MLLPDRGTLLVSTDLHGNYADFERLREVFRRLADGDAEVHWAILGDTVHGPDEASRKRLRQLYDFEDRSWEIVRGILDLQRDFPQRLHYVLGNHDYGHLGGAPTAKFYADEVAALESRLTPEQVADLQRLFSTARLALIAPCGALLSHGAAGDDMQTWAELMAVRLPPTNPRERELVRSMVSAYGRPREDFERVAAKVRRELGITISMNIHGHDREEAGFCVGQEGVHAMPCLFGAPDGNKRYLVLDLAARYESARSLREGQEIQRLYPELPPAEPVDYWS